MIQVSLLQIHTTSLKYISLQLLSPLFSWNVFPQKGCCVAVMRMNGDSQMRSASRSLFLSLSLSPIWKQPPYRALVEISRCATVWKMYVVQLQEYPSHFWPFYTMIVQLLDYVRAGQFLRINFNFSALGVLYLNMGNTFSKSTLKLLCGGKWDTCLLPIAVPCMSTILLNAF